MKIPDLLGLTEALHLPLFKTSSSRLDFDFGRILLAIGLEQTGFVPPPLFGEGARFMQNPAAREGKRIPIGRLLLDEPGAKTVAECRDLFVRGGQRDHLCPVCAALALYVHSLFAGVGGAGLRPGALANSTLYLRRGNTLAQTVAANLMDTPVSASAYFSSPNAIWLDDPGDPGACAICGKTAPLVTRCWRRGGLPPVKPDANPHLAISQKTGKRHLWLDGYGELKMLDAAAPGNTLATIAALDGRARAGDTVIMFGTLYEPASRLKNLFWREFQIRQPLNHAILEQGVKSICVYTRPRGVFDTASGFAGEIRANQHIRIIHRGETEMQAALATYQQYCPEPGILERDHARWKTLRSWIEKAGESKNVTI
jgi:hypothetical protein